VSVSVTVVPEHSAIIPCIGLGLGLTVTTAVARQVLVVYEMVLVPVKLALAVTSPEDDPIMATSVVPLHIPPGLASLSVLVPPLHKDKLPLMTTDGPLTVIVIMPVQPVAVVYVIIALPSAIPVTTPVGLTVANAVDPELHVPPVTTSCSAVVPPGHTVVVPLMAGTVLTVTTVVAMQPADPAAE
jgi:hypothetical protein